MLTFESCLSLPHQQENCLWVLLSDSQNPQLIRRRACGGAAIGRQGSGLRAPVWRYLVGLNERRRRKLLAEGGDDDPFDFETQEAFEARYGSDVFRAHRPIAKHVQQLRHTSATRAQRDE